MACGERTQPPRSQSPIRTGQATRLLLCPERHKLRSWIEIVNLEPEYLHVLLNHLPLVGLMVAVVVLVAALLLRNRPATILGLALVGLLAVSAWPVIESGRSNYVRVRELADEDGKAHLRHHMVLAERWDKLYYATAAVAALGLLAAWKWPRGFQRLAVLAALLAAGSLVAGAVIADAGGKVRHPEFRAVPPPAHNPLEPEHEHAH